MAEETKEMQARTVTAVSPERRTGGRGVRESLSGANPLASTGPAMVGTGNQSLVAPHDALGIRY